MAMLAEPRRKHRSSFNPRGKYWTEDSNKIGQKMLEKMGWSKGKGLGVKEQGNTDICRIPYKNDAAGIGYNKTPESWIKSQEQFNELLQQLHKNPDQNIYKLENKNDNPNEQSLELKSKQSRARVHYQKFVHGKDLKNYNSKDLANIFGQKELNDKIANKKDDIYEKDAIGTQDNRYGIVTINSGNMTDYFTSMLKNKQANKSLASNTINNVADFESENERLGFGFGVGNTLSDKFKPLKDSEKSEKSNYAFDNPCLGLNSPVDSTSNDTYPKSGKKRKKEFENEMNKYNVRKKLKTEIIDSNYENVFTNPALNLDTKSEEKHNGKEFEVSRAEFGLENCGLDLSDEKNNKKKVTFNNHIMLYEYNTDFSKKKKGQAKLDKFEVENKKPKKKQKHNNTIPVSDGFINKALDVETLCDEINDNELNEDQNKKIKKKKVCKISSLETIHESSEQEKEIIAIKIEPEVIISENEKSEIVDQKSKKKKKKKKIEVEEIIEDDIKNKELDIKSEEIIKNKKIKKDNNKEGEILISKKYKNKKKDKDNYKVELEHTIQTDIDSNKKDIDILEKPNMRQQQIDYSVGIKNKNANGIETMQELQAQGDIKRKRKKNIDKKDCLEINVCDVEKEISNKENADKDADNTPQDVTTEKLTKKDKRKKSKDMNVSNIEDFSCNTEITVVNSPKDVNVKSTKFIDSSTRKNKIVNVIHSPLHAKAKMTKKMLKTILYSNLNNLKLNFPNSNTHDIKGYKY